MSPKTVSLAVILVLSASCLAQDNPDTKSGKPDVFKERAVRSKHTVKIAGEKLSYEAAAGTMLLKEEDGKSTASIFYIAYTKDGADLGKRPVTFCFNGGPGSSSVWLHLGTFGPRRVQLSEAGEAPKPPARLVDNEWSILDVTDLVFIDPVSTGYSRAVDEKNASKFHGVEEDGQSVAEFIRLYTTRNKRWQSPKYLAGESYGTTRCAVLASLLQSQHNMSL